MALYAQTVIEVPGPGGQEKFLPGDEVPKDLDGIDELKEGGAVGTSKPDLEKEAGDGGSGSDVSG